MGWSKADAVVARRLPTFSAPAAGCTLDRVSAGRVFTAVAKVGVFCCIVFIGVAIFRGTSAPARLSEAWSMYRCPGRVQADLGVLLMEKSPKVRNCVGPAARAVCEVETVEWRAPCGTETPGPRRIVKTAPLGPWDCTRRHVPGGHAGLVMKVLIDGKMNGPMYSALLRTAASASPRDRQLIEERDSVRFLLSRRQALADAQ